MTEENIKILIAAVKELLELKFPIQPCSHYMIGDEDICDGCKYEYEKKQAEKFKALRSAIIPFN